MPKRSPTISGAPRGRADYDRARGSRQERGYDETWRRCRDTYLRRHPLCAACLREGRTTIAADVDHITPLRQGGARLDESNLQSLCRRCHNVKTASERAGCRQSR